MQLRWNPRSIIQLYQKHPILVITRTIVGLIILATLYTIIQAISDWRTLSTIETSPTPDIATPAKTIESNEPAEEIIDAQQISEWHLFGKPGASQFGPDIDPSEIPITSLELKLKGVLSINGKGSAIIADKEGVDKFYVVGATLPGPAILRAVYPDRILLEYRARLETLWIETPENLKPGQESKSDNFSGSEEEEFLDEEFTDFEEEEEIEEEEE